MADSIEQYTKTSCDVTEVRMGMMSLATALALARVHGVQFAATYLFEAGINLDVAIELLCTERTRAECGRHLIASVRKTVQPTSVDAQQRRRKI